MASDQKKNNIILSGGGTGGSVTPLLAVAEQLMLDNKQSLNYLFFGTKSGPEREILASADLAKDFKFIALPAGKWRRYFSYKNFFDIFLIIYAFFLSLIYLYRYRPRFIFSAGAFVSVPLVWAAFFFRIPVLIHQQDLRPGLANRLMAPVAKLVGVCLADSAKAYGRKAIVIGNPIRRSLINEIEKKKEKYRQDWRFRHDLPILLVIGGGTGALALNKLINETWPLIKGRWQVVHICGRTKDFHNSINDPDYRLFNFLPNKDLIALMAIADLLISRAGLGVLTEISALAKPAIIVPMPNSHQEDNAKFLADQKAAWVMKQSELKAEDLLDKLNYFKENKAIAQSLAKKINQIISLGAEKKIAEILNTWLKNDN